MNVFRVRVVAGWGASFVLLFCIALAPTAALAQEAPERAIAVAHNQIGLALFRILSATPGNLVFSSLSIATAMTMTRVGARGQTELEIAKALRQGPDRDAVSGAAMALQKALASYDKSSVPPRCPQGTTFTGERCEGPAPAAGRYCAGRADLVGGRCVAAADFLPSAKLLSANALMIPKGAAGTISQDYSGLLARAYDGSVLQNITLDDVNAWVQRRTEGKIDRIIDQLDSGGIVILNAIYFKARWAEVFRREATRNERFNLSGRQSVSVPTMRLTGTYVTVARQGYRAIRLPYSVRSLGMIVVLPNEIEGLASISARITPQELSQVATALGNGKPTSVQLSLPRFKSSFKVDLINAFKRLGVTQAFDRQRANFSGMTGAAKGSLFIHEIAHRAVIDVTEVGTEAAAATAVVLAPGAGGAANPQVFRVDRPFLFYIVDSVTGAVLFQGRIVDPR